jgi:hypothetical protein
VRRLVKEVSTSLGNGVAALVGPTSALGHKRTLRSALSVSALPPKADIPQRRLDVGFVPEADSCTAARSRYSITSSAPASSAAARCRAAGRISGLPIDAQIERVFPVAVPATSLESERTMRLARAAAMPSASRGSSAGARGCACRLQQRSRCRAQAPRALAAARQRRPRIRRSA